VSISPIRIDKEFGGARPPPFRSARIAILDAARRQLRSRSYAAFFLEDVAAAAGFSSRTVYRQFPSKENLYQESRQALLNELYDTVAVEVPSRMRPADALLFVARHVYDLAKDARHLELIQSMRRDETEQPWLAQSYHRYFHLPLVQGCELYILRKLKCDEASPDYPRIMAEQLVTLVKMIGVREMTSDGVDFAGTEIGYRHLQVIVSAYASLLEHNGLPKLKFPGQAQVETRITSHEMANY